METRNAPRSRDRQVRAAKNQALFREVNERVEKLNEAFSLLLPVGEFVCECADAACAERIGLTMQEYEAVRAHASRFLVAPGDAHYVPEVERVVEKHERFWIVEKFEDGGRVAAGLNPRTRERIGDG